MKRIIKLCITTILILSLTVPIYASPIPMVWAYNEADNGYIDSITNTIVSHIPEHTIKSFNDHQGSVVISAIKCDQLGIAGITNGEPTASGWYRWPDNKVYVDITPSYGLHMMQGTVLHEFGHVFDMEMKATDNSAAKLIIQSELMMYNQLEKDTGYMIPPIKDEHELFAQVFAAVISKNDGTVNNSRDIIDVCPGTAQYIKSMLKNG